MKIIIVILKQHKELSGGAKFLIDIYKLLKRNGYCVKVLVPKNAVQAYGFYSDDVISLPSINNKLLKWFIYFFMVPLKVRNFSIVHYSEDIPIVFNRVINFFLNRNQLLINTVHDLGEFRTTRFSGVKDRIRRFIVPLEIRAANGILAVSDSTRRDLISILGCNSDKIDVVYNPVVLGIKRMEEEGLSSDFSLALKNKYLLYISSINHPSKNHVNLIEAFEILCKQGKSFDLVLVGKKMYNADIVLGRINHSPFKERIHYLGYISDSELYHVIRSSFIYVFPSNFEGFGRGLIEAWYFEKPVVSSPNGSLKEIASDAALYFDPSSPEDIAEKINLLHENVDLRNELIDRGNVRLSYFQEDEILKQLLKAYKI